MQNNQNNQNKEYYQFSFDLDSSKKLILNVDNILTEYDTNSLKYLVFNIIIFI